MVCANNSGVNLKSVADVSTKIGWPPATVTSAMYNGNVGVGIMTLSPGLSTDTIAV